MIFEDLAWKDRIEKQISEKYETTDKASLEEEGMMLYANRWVSLGKAHLSLSPGQEEFVVIGSTT